MSVQPPVSRAYEDHVAEVKLLRDLSISEAQIAADQVIPHEKVVRHMREKYAR